ncbi:MAG: adenylyltransferase/cytidyltransferase family protein [Candidatus Sungbacteria bacterium]|nr:adenylyltransferase/cytidyltransferase family protein [Candidatus Sungbacteria bacterium]
MSKIKRVMVFGVFDRLHPGHLDFLRQAAEHGDELIAVVARDRMVAELKNKIPLHSEQERLAAVGKVLEVTLAVLGDEVQGSYNVIAEHKPDVICVGYDQHGLTKDLEEKMVLRSISQFIVVRLESHYPEKFHTSHLA